MKKCSKCKKEKKEFEFGKDSYRPDGLCCSCKECQKEYRENNKEKKRNYYLDNREKIIKRQNAFQSKHREEKRQYNKLYGPEYHIKHKCEAKYIFRRYKSDAKRRNIFFNLKFDEFVKFENQFCEYCGEELDRIRIDRLDNSQGYIFNNCVPCCQICNITKNTLNVNEWKEYIEQIIIFNKTGQTRTITRQRSFIGNSKQFLNYRYNAKRKNISFGISFEEFLFFDKKPCYYCGTITDNFIGIDRIDNMVGYDLNNCVPCCKICNGGKNCNQINIWENWILKIINFNSNEDL